MRRPAASTVLKRPVTAKRTKNYNNVAGTDTDKRKNAKWLWVAVETGGAGGVKKTHVAGNKQVVVRMRPRAADAPGGKPRGKEPLQHQFEATMAPHTKIVADSWKATAPAVLAAGLTMAGPVNHLKGFKDLDTRYHSNDAEPEISRINWHTAKGEARKGESPLNCWGGKRIHRTRPLRYQEKAAGKGNPTRNALSAAAERI